MNTKEGFTQSMDKAAHYLSNKYGEEFVMDSYEEGDILSDTDIIRFFANGMDQKHEYVEVIANPDSPEGFSDNYFGYLIRPAMEEEIKNVLDVEECKIYRENIDYTLPDSLNNSNTIEDLYQEMPDYWMTVNIFLPVSQYDYDEIASKLESWMVSNGHSYTVKLFVLNQEWYDRIDRYELDDFWRFYATHKNADYENVYYVYTKIIIEGGIS